MSDMISRADAIALAPRFPMPGLYCEKSPEERAALNAVAAYQNAIRALPAVEVGVKPLEWRSTTDGAGHDYGVTVADCPVFEKRFWAERPDKQPKIEAKRAARIRSALTATPAQDVEGRAVKVIDDRIAAILADEESIMSPARQVISQWASSVIAELENIRAALARVKG